MINITDKTINDVYFRLLWEMMETDANDNYVNAYTVGIDHGSYGKNFGGDQYRLQAELVTLEIEMPETRPLAVSFPEGSNIPPVTSEKKIEEYFVDYLANVEIPASESYTYGTRLSAWPHAKKEELYKISSWNCLDKSRIIGPINKSYLGRDGVQWYNSQYLNENGSGSTRYAFYIDTKYTEVTFNQLEWIIKHLKDYPQNNHCCAQIAKGTDFTLKSAPCLRLLSWKLVPDSTGEMRLNITLFFRSWDIYAGLPTNLGGLQLLNEYVADAVGVKSGKMFVVSDGAHLYKMYIPLVKQRLGRL